MKFYIYYIFFFFSFFSNSVFPQTAKDTFGSIISFETMHVHFDKDIYLPGETIWFKAYLYNVNEISFAATNFYTAIYDEKGKLIQQKQYPILDGSCYGDFEIPDTIQSSRIQFRAFTKPMIIDDSNNIYERTLTVYSKIIYGDSILKTTTKQLQFFSEGGQMIAELENYIAFKATYTDGTPTIINGQIIEVERNKVVDTFFTNNLGLGKIGFSPLPGKNYIAVWKDENGIIKQTGLPVNHRYGVTFHVEIINKELQYSIAKNKTSDSLNALHIIAQMGNYLIYKADLQIKNEMELYTVKFGIDDTPSGLMQLTLFDKSWNIIQERMIFINDKDTCNRLSINIDTINKIPKGKNSIEITLSDSMFTNLSVSIADVNFYNQLNTYSITQDLLLRPQLKNLTLDACYLLNKNNLINLVTLTHEWKKYNWQKLIHKEELKPVILDNYISLSVNYKEKNLALPTNDGLNLIISNNGLGKQFYNLNPSSQTAFKISNLIFFDSVKVSYQMDKNKKLAEYLTISKTDTVIIPLSVPALPNKIYFQNAKKISPQNNIDIFINDNSNKFNKVKTLQDIKIQSKYKGNPTLARIDELDKIYTTGMFSGARGYQLNVLDDPSAKTINDVASYVAYRVPGVKIIDNGIDKYFVIEETVGFGRKQITQVPTFLDELPYSTGLGNFDLSQVAYIKYIPGIVLNSFFKSSVGAIYVYTKKGNEKGSPVKGLPFVYIKGYNLQKEFINLNYKDKDLLTQSDLRTTLYWNPNLIMDKLNNKIKIEYYNNDFSKIKVLTIEGVNAEGKLIHIQKIIE